MMTERLVRIAEDETAARIQCRPGFDFRGRPIFAKPVTYRCADHPDYRDEWRA